MADNLDGKKVVNAVDRRNRVDDSDEEKNQLYKMNKTKYGIVNPSFLSNGNKLNKRNMLSTGSFISIIILSSFEQLTHLNNPTLFIHMTILDISHPSSPINNVIGISGRRIDFSCTWNENRKNAIDTADRV